MSPAAIVERSIGGTSNSAGDPEHGVERAHRSDLLTWGGPQLRHSGPPMVNFRRRLVPGIRTGFWLR